MTTQEAQRKLMALRTIIKKNNDEAERCFAEERLLDMAKALEANGKLIAEGHVLARIMLKLPLDS